ncbi:MAG: lipid-A-disaccharide synthase, partial [Candidatus Omnitrophica bacterium]|nr:lipid-A-disaccharide synthase [Candidatus Omnitrophota bacterium]
AVVASGTATLEAAIAEKPFVLVYKASSLTYILYRTFVNLPFLGLVNIVAGKGVIPELLQGDFTTENLSKTILSLIKDEKRLSKMRKELHEVRLSLGETGSSKRAAQKIKNFIDSRLPK